MPLDPEPNPEGNVVLDRGVASVLPRTPPGDVTLFEQEPDTRTRYTSHFATCPHADTHRRPR